MRTMRLAAALFFTFFCLHSVTQGQNFLVDHEWVGGVGSQNWQVNGNWNPAGYPNDTDPNGALAVANFSVSLGGDLNVSLGANVRVAGVILGGTAGAVTSEISSTLGKIRFSSNELLFPAGENADFSFNNRVDGADFLVYQMNVGETGADLRQKGDANGDEVVDAEDLAIWREQYGRGGGISSEGAAFIHSLGVPGSTNIISSPFHSDNQSIEIAGTNDLTFTQDATFTFNGDNTGTGSGASLSVNKNITVTMNGGIVVHDHDPNDDGTDLSLNSSGRTQGTLIINGVISDSDPNDAGFLQVGVAGGARSPLNTVILKGDNTFTGTISMGRTNLVLGSDNALGKFVPVPEDPEDPVDPEDIKYAKLTQGGPANEFGYNIVSDDNDRTIQNPIVLRQYVSFKGSNSLTLAGDITQSNNRGFVNNIESSEQLVISGRIDIWEDDEDIMREFEFDGSGHTLITGMIRDQPDEPDFETGRERRISKSGTGVLTIDVAPGDNEHTGPTVVSMGNLHYANDGSLNVGPGLILAHGGAVGVDTGVAGNSALNDRIDPDSTGGLMLASSEGSANLDFTSSLSSAAGMTVAAPETGIVFTGTITPANSTYGLGGGTGTLTLPNATLSGGNAVEIRNGGTVELLGDNTYTGATEIRSKYTASHEQQAEADSSNGNDAVGTFFDTVVSPTLVVDHLADGGNSSSIGASGSAAGNLLIHASTLKYVGTGDSTNRLFTIGTGGATIDSSGTGAVVFDNPGALGRRDITSAIGTLDDQIRNPHEVYELQNVGGGDIRDIIVGMEIHDPDPHTTPYETGFNCGGPDGMSYGPIGGGAGENCISLYEDEDGFLGHDSEFDPNTAKALVVKVTGLSDDGKTLGFDSAVHSVVLKEDTTITFGAVPRTLTLAGDNTDDNEIESIISDSVADSVVSIAKAGPGKWILSGSNTYTGETIVEDGILSITSAFLDPNSDVTVQDDGVLDLDFVGTNVIDDLFFSVEDNATEQPEGLWGAIGNGAATFTSSFFTGSGLLNVGGVSLTEITTAVPEPSSFMLVAMAYMGLVGCRRRSRAS